MRTTMLDVETGDGVADAFLAQPDGAGARPGVLVFMDGIGLRPRLYEMAERIAADGYVTLVPNLYYRAGRAPLIDDLENLLKQEDRTALMAKLGPLVQSVRPEPAMRDFRCWLGELRARGAADGPIGVVGYCMGGGLALRAAGRYPEDVAAAASYHGGRLATDAPDSPHLQVDRVRGELCFGHADNDQSMPPEQIKRLEAALDATGIRYTSELYAGATHGFTMADTAAYDAAAEDRHWATLLPLFARNLPQPS